MKQTSGRPIPWPVFERQKTWLLRKADSIAKFSQVWGSRPFMRSWLRRNDNVTSCRALGKQTCIDEQMGFVRRHILFYNQFMYSFCLDLLYSCNSSEVMHIHLSVQLYENGLGEVNVSFEHASIRAYVISTTCRHFYTPHIRVRGMRLQKKTSNEFWNKLKYSWLTPSQSFYGPALETLPRIKSAETYRPLFNDWLGLVGSTKFAQT